MPEQPSKTYSHPLDKPLTTNIADIIELYELGDGEVGGHNIVYGYYLATTAIESELNNILSTAKSYKELKSQLLEFTKGREKLADFLHDIRHPEKGYDILNIGD